MSDLLALCYKGRRDYLHGTDMYTAMYAAVNARFTPERMTNINFVVSRMAHSQLLFGMGTLPLPEANTPPSPPVATLTFEYGEVKYRAWVAESGIPVACRSDYDEEIIRSLCQYANDSKTVTMAGSSGYSPIENTVAVTKYLHQRAYPEAVGQWIFCRLETAAGLPTAGPISVRLTHAPSTRLTKSTVSCDGVDVANIYFSLMASP